LEDKATCAGVTLFLGLLATSGVVGLGGAMASLADAMKLPPTMKDH